MTPRRPHRPAGRRTKPVQAQRTVLIANPGADLYGSDRMVLETVAALAGAGHRVVLTVPGPGPLIELARRAGAEVLTTPTPIIRKSALRPIGMITLIAETARSIAPGVRLFRAIRPDIVLVNTITPPLWFGLARVFRVPLIAHVHEGEASVPRPVRIALAAPLLLADRLIVNSEFSLGVVAEAIPALRQRAVVIYNAVAGPPSVTAARPVLKAPIRLLYVGRLSARKGPDVAVRAVALLRDRGVEVSLTLVGAVFAGYEWYLRELEREIEAAGIGDRVELAGFQTDRWPATQESDIVVVPSTVDEPFGNVAVEAGLAARPLIVSDMSGLLEAAAGIRSAVQVPPSDPEAIADAVTAIAADWANYSDQAISDAAELAERYSHQGYAAQVNAVVLDLLGTAQEPVRTAAPC